MSEEQLKAFLKKVKADTSLQEKLKATASPEAALEIAKEAGFSITSEDIQSMQSATVSDEELESAAGGLRLTLTGRRDTCCGLFSERRQDCPGGR
jgi:predicted ribosomally synthesized peptide with nif11-like leader